MVKKYNNLLRLCDSDRFIPVCIAALYGDTDMQIAQKKEIAYYYYKEETSEKEVSFLSFFFKTIKRDIRSLIE